MNSCPEKCTGHRGKLLLLMIRMRHTSLVTACLNAGLPAVLQCCTGQTKELYWDVDSRGKRISKSEEEEEDDDDYESFKKKPEKKKKEDKPKPTNHLRAIYEFETPLSTAVVIGHVDIVKKLIEAGANPVRCEDAAIRAAVKIILKLTNKRILGKQDVVVTKSDPEFILEKVCEVAQKKFDSGKGKRKYVPPNYCTIALLYQAVLENLWDAVEILTKVRVSSRRKNRGLVAPEDRFAKLLSTYNIQHSIPENVLNTKSKVKAKKGGSKGLGKFATMGMKAFGVNRSERFKQETGNFSSAQSVSSHGTIMMTADGSEEIVNDMNEDICYIVVRVIDKLMDQLRINNNATHARGLMGIVTLLEKYNLYLDKRRFDKILISLVTILKFTKPGDVAAVKAMFKNKQFRHYLGFTVDPSWEYRSIDAFIKHHVVKKLLRISPTAKKESSFQIGESKDSVLCDIFVEAAKTDLDWLLKDLRENGVLPDEEMVEEALVGAAEEENLNAIRMIAKLYGKKWLSTAFAAALASGAMDTIQEILIIDQEMKDANFSLVESYIGQLLTSKPKQEDAEEEKASPVEPGLVLKFFFVCANMTMKIVNNILVSAFQQNEILNGEVVKILLRTTIEYKEENPVSKELLDLYLESKQVQYDNRDDKIQTTWLTLLLEIYKLAVSNNESLEDEYNDKVVGLLELKPKFKEFIEVDAEDEGDEDEPQGKSRNPGWTEQSELL